LAVLSWQDVDDLTVTRTDARRRYAGALSSRTGWVRT